MRPPKKILLVGDNEERVSLLAYVLHIHHYCVVTAQSASEAEQLLVEASADLLLVLWPLDRASEFLKGFKAIDRGVPVLVLAYKVSYDAALQTFWANVDGVLWRDHCSSAEILDRVKLMSARKRGPRPGRPRS